MDGSGIRHVAEGFCFVGEFRVELPFPGDQCFQRAEQVDQALRAECLQVEQPSHGKLAEIFRSFAEPYLPQAVVRSIFQRQILDTHTLRRLGEMPSSDRAILTADVHPADNKRGQPVDRLRAQVVPHALVEIAQPDTFQRRSENQLGGSGGGEYFTQCAGRQSLVLARITAR